MVDWPWILAGEFEGYPASPCLVSGGSGPSRGEKWEKKEGLEGWSVVLHHSVPAKAEAGDLLSPLSEASLVNGASSRTA